MSPTKALLRGKVDFWRQFIQERENRREPVHPRMWEALAYAECKLQGYLSNARQGTSGTEKITDQWLH